MKHMKVLILGGGAFSTALATLLAKNCQEILIYTRNQEVVRSINNEHRNYKYLNEFTLSSNITAISQLDDVDWSELDAIFFALPARTFRETLEKIAKDIIDIPLIICSKGLDRKNLKFLSDVAIRKYNLQKVGVLAGPNFAREITLNLPTCADLATTDYDLYNQLRKYLENENFKLSHSQCLIATQVGGIVKNIAAIACGVILGADLGYNLRSLAITKAFQEMKMLCKKLGGKSGMLSGGSGLADLILTCTSDLSRNFTFGKEIGRTSKIPSENLPEGFFAAETLHLLCKKIDLELPLCDFIYQILHNKQNLINIKSLINNLFN